jgi:hypothetical protein
MEKDLLWRTPPADRRSTWRVELSASPKTATSQDSMLENRSTTSWGSTTSWAWQKEIEIMRTDIAARHIILDQRDLGDLIGTPLNVLVRWECGYEDV